MAPCWCNDNRQMSRFILTALACLFVLGGCSPALNWREVRLAGTPLKALLPCKPDEGSRKMPMVGLDVEMRMSGCEAGDALFAIAWVDVKDAAQAGAAIAQWQTAMLANMQATSTQVADFSPRGADARSQGVRVVATGRRQDGHAVAAQGVWFARGPQVFHAVMYATQLSPETVDAFFSGIELQ